MTILMILSKPADNDVRVLQEQQSLNRFVDVDILDSKINWQTHKFWWVWWILATPVYFLRAGHYDVYHCHDHDTLLLGLLLKWRYGSMLVLDQHEFWFEMIKRDKRQFFSWYWRLVQAFAVPFMDLHIRAVDSMPALCEHSVIVRNAK